MVHELFISNVLTDKDQSTLTIVIYNISREYPGKSKHKTSSAKEFKFAVMKTYKKTNTLKHKQTNKKNQSNTFQKERYNKDLNLQYV